MSLGHRSLACLPPMVWSQFPWGPGSRKPEDHNCYSHISACICMHLHPYACICLHVHTYAFVCMHMHACACIYMHMHASACICMHVHAYACTCSEPAPHPNDRRGGDHHHCGRGGRGASYPQTHIYIYIYTYIYIYMYICLDMSAPPFTWVLGV